MAQNLRSKLEAAIAPIVTAMGYEFWGMELLSQGRHSLVRVYIDTEQGVTLDDLSKVSYQISGLLDVENIMLHRYELEVSSPGINRSLFNIDQYRRYIGKKVRLRLRGHEALRRRNYLGVIAAVSDGDIFVDIGEEERLCLQLENIDKANIESDL